MKKTSLLFRLRASKRDGQHHAVSAFRAVDKVVVRQGQGDTREDAIAQSIGRRRMFYGDPGVERDLVVAELRGEDIVLTAEGEYLHHAA